MKIVTILFLLLSGFTLAAQEITFGDTKHDFGVIREADGQVFYDFYFMNTGEEPLQIQSVLVGCGCTTSEWSREPVKPGEKGHIRVSYHPVGRNEKRFTAIAEIYTNSKNYGTHKGVHGLCITGEVSREEPKPLNHYLLTTVRNNLVSTPEKTDDYVRMLERMRMELLHKRDISKTDEETAKQVASLRRGGMWEDIDYACYFRTNWEPITHLNRVCGFALSYVCPESIYYANDTLYRVIEDALAFWKQRSPKCHNWWFNQIAVPQQLGNIFVLMDAGRKKLPDGLRQALFGMMAWPDPRKWTGANKLDIAMHHIQRGCLLKNDSIVRAASEQAFYPISITSAEGLQVDLSYQQHDNQLYIGSYGTVFAEGETKVAYWLQGTPYALQGERLELFRQFILTTYLNVFRGSYNDFSVVGRGISRVGQLNGRATADMLDKLGQLDPDYAPIYKEAKTRFTEPCQGNFRREPANRVYWRSDYTLHNREKYDFSVRTASVRTRKTESGNGENLTGGYLSDGATDIRVNGNEYFQIFPVWDWTKIPGVTAPQVVTAPAVAWGEKGKAEFSGGVSDGRYGAMAFHMIDYGMEARKSWFFFDDEVVCLGAGIKTGSTEKIVTCINQCLLDGGVTFDKGHCPAMKSAEGIALKPAVKRIIHDSILYILADDMNVRLFCGKQTGNWNTINYNEPDEEVEKQVFKLWIEHEEGKENAGYAYIVVPGVTDMRQYNDRWVKIEKNEPQMQVVYHQALDILQAVFYQAGTFDNGRVSLSVDTPCVVMVKNTKASEPEIRVADPTQKAKECTVLFQRDGNNVSKTFTGDELLGVKYKNGINF